jgi:hypothetical protein
VMSEALVADSSITNGCLPAQHDNPTPGMDEGLGKICYQGSGDPGIA